MRSFEICTFQSVLLRSSNKRGWDAMGWDGMGWDGMGWDGMGWVIHAPHTRNVKNAYRILVA
jgi:hypothetical protein